MHERLLYSSPEEAESVKHALGYHSISLLGLLNMAWFVGSDKLAVWWPGCLNYCSHTDIMCYCFIGKPLFCVTILYIWNLFIHSIISGWLQCMWCIATFLAQMHLTPISNCGLCEYCYIKMKLCIYHFIKCTEFLHFMVTYYLYITPCTSTQNVMCFFPFSIF